MIGRFSNKVGKELQIWKRLEGLARSHKGGVWKSRRSINNPDRSHFSPVVVSQEYFYFDTLWYRTSIPKTAQIPILQGDLMAARWQLLRSLNIIPLCNFFVAAGARHKPEEVLIEWAEELWNDADSEEADYESVVSGWSGQCQVHNVAWYN